MKCIEDEIPFEVPEGWEWTRLKSISYIGTGATPLKSHKAYYNNGNVAWITSAATAEPYISKPTSYITELALVETNCTVYQPGTLVIAMYGEGKTRGQISELQISAATNQACAAVSLIDKSTSLRSYIKCFFIHSYEELRSKAKGGQQPNLNQTIIADMLVPIPPSSELYGIMGIVDKALGCINIISAARQMIQNNAEKIKQHILSLAIRGQLVPQNLGDEPASELLNRIRAEKEVLIQQGKIKRDKRESIIFRSDDNSYYERFKDGTVICVDKEVLFDLPDGWAWERLSNIAWFSGGKTPSMSHAEYWNGNVPWITSKDMKTKYITTSIVKMTEEGAATQQLYTSGTVLVVARSGILRHTLPVAILNTKATINQDIKAIELVDKSLTEYIYICLKALERNILLKFTKAGTTVENINFDEFVRIMLPIPPSEEIHRIIDRLSQTDRLIDSINDYIM